MTKSYDRDAKQKMRAMDQTEEWTRHLEESCEGDVERERLKMPRQSHSHHSHPTHSHRMDRENKENIERVPLAPIDTRKGGGRISQSHSHGHHHHDKLGGGRQSMPTIEEEDHVKRSQTTGHHAHGHGGYQQQYR